MIPRFQRVLFWSLLLAAVAMAAALIRLRERAGDRIAGHDPVSETTPPAEPTAASKETITLMEANDLDGSVAPVTRQLALPQETGARARLLLRQLFADYATPESKHPLAPGPGVEQVFFMPGEKATHGTSNSDRSDAPETAIVNLTAVFADNHPSGIEVETLTLLSIISTLHETFPAVQQVRFLVDGRQRETLAGHADLTRAYLTSTPEAHQ